MVTVNGKRTAIYADNRHHLRRRTRGFVDAALGRWHRYCYLRKPPTFRTDPHFLLRRKTLLTLACFILLVGAVFRPLSFVWLLWRRKFIAVLVAGLLAGALVREVAAVCLGTKGRLWYTRWEAPAFVLLAIVAVNVAAHVADRLVFKVVGMGPFLSSAAATHVLIAFELIGIAVLR
jgi:hypothetical protein